MKTLNLIFTAALVASLAAFGSTAWATGTHTPSQSQSQTQSTNNENYAETGDSVSESFSDAYVDAGGDAVATGGNPTATSAGGNSSSSSRATNGDQTLNVSYDTDYKKRVPDVHTAALTTGDCFGSWSAGHSKSAFGISFGKTTVDPDCNTRRNAITMDGLGEVEVAIELMCGIPEVAAADKRASEPVCAENAEEILAQGVITMQPAQAIAAVNPAVNFNRR